jgi:methylmalonyl-CoA mutase N-terminal domain/subunit
MSEITFRDFAGAVMAGNVGAAGNVLETLLGLDAARAGAAAAHFQRQMTQAGPAFMMKAMGLRTAVQSGSDDEVRALLVECFGLDDASAGTAVAALRARYPR